ncbi:hypothetical protein BC829DRAFT_398159 [Chytridium lagenaria]|nr:hypothetical protein BC829DRAFT_398159 [Chytridium lagenaria]
MGGDAVRNGDGRVLNGKGSEASLRSDGGVVVNTALPPRPTLTARPRSGPLTDEERRMYYKKGWCTYCRAEDHIIADCQLAARPGKTSVKGSVHVAAMPIHAKACVGYGSYLHTVGSCNVFLSKRGTT